MTRLCALIAVLAASGCAQSDFSFSGSITAPPPIQKLTERPNLVLYVVATNSGGVPVAVKKIVNPRLPIHYRMTADDLILPGDIWDGPLTVTVVVNNHGTLGVSKPGDLRGTHRGLIRSGARHVDIVINQKA